jgi:hypothetical protein
MLVPIPFVSRGVGPGTNSDWVSLPCRRQRGNARAVTGDAWIEADLRRDYSGWS